MQPRKPKLLITGGSAIHVGSDRRPVKYAVPNQVIVDTMAEAGWDVDRRTVIPGEDLSGYDKVVVYLINPVALTAQSMYGALWALGTRPDALVAIDDWQSRQILSGFRTAVKDDCKRLLKPLLPRKHREALNDPAVLAVVKEMANKLAQPELDREGLWHAFGSGSPLKMPFYKLRKIHNYDPSSYFALQYEAAVPAFKQPLPLKQRRWLMASLLSKQSWLDRQTFGWEVTSYGNKKQGQPRVDEVELCHVYLSSWGVISPPHGLHGSGWWRIRYLLAAMAGCIVVGDPRETNLFGHDYTVMAKHVEEMTEEELRFTADLQRQRYFEQTPSIDSLRQTIINIFN